jgi:ABC-type bacteriocin/lantibiotic exporter with double-glycine peptidase domain
MVVRLTSDIDAAQDFIASVLLGTILDAITIVGMLCVMAYLDWHFTLITLSVIPLLFAVVYRLTRRIKQATREVKKAGERARVGRAGVDGLGPRHQGVFPRGL